MNDNKLNFIYIKFQIIYISFVFSLTNINCKNRNTENNEFTNNKPLKINKYQKQKQSIDKNKLITKSKPNRKAELKPILNRNNDVIIPHQKTNDIKQIKSEPVGNNYVKLQNSNPENFANIETDKEINKDSINKSDSIKKSKPIITNSKPIEDIKIIKNVIKQEKISKQNQIKIKSKYSNLNIKERLKVLFKIKENYLQKVQKLHKKYYPGKKIKYKGELREHGSLKKNLRLPQDLKTVERIIEILYYQAKKIELPMKLQYFLKIYKPLLEGKDKRKLQKQANDILVDYRRKIKDLGYKDYIDLKIPKTIVPKRKKK
ncbi:MAG: hypothetical protein GY830_06355 [Bacteroidetes bacterium]|nr:hypothetical protein [Bacteroidota bacterium]